MSSTTCKYCRHTFGGGARQRLLAESVYWCPGCSRLFKLFNPYPPAWFAPELAAEAVLARQKAHYDFGKRTGWFRN